MGCLSRMRGNLHVRFLGEGVAVRLPPYPPHEEGSTPFTRSKKQRAPHGALVRLRLPPCQPIWQDSMLRECRWVPVTGNDTFSPSP